MRAGFKRKYMIFSTLRLRVLISFSCHINVIFLSRKRYNIIVTKGKDNKFKDKAI